MPLVSVIVPCYNEQATIGLLLDAIRRQTFPVQDIEVIIADGISSDGTRDEIAAYQEAHPELVIHLVENPKRIIPAALNCALAAAAGRYIIRLDAHSAPAVEYIERCVRDLEVGKGENIGGVWEIRPRGNGLFQRAIAIAASHPLGVGDAQYRFTTRAGYVDTVPFGAFRRELFDRLGGFNESLLTNEDYEFNARLRQDGGRIWLDPQIRSTYFARPDLAALTRQYWRYGYWKWQMLRRYPKTLRWRQALPPLMVSGLLFMIVLALIWAPAGYILAGGLLVYFLALAAGSIPAAARRRDLRLVFAVPVAIMTMHLSWGGGFLWSLATTLFRNPKS
jgi:glycosyltransferase involved in cell wall biosynthesis